ncbi:TetR/AcrR family transcriptional regulator [Chryseobacterium sp. Ch-15]|uniref:TetR/AcrR family transcriptional regulator n=1 Tax=Chryseobacterium muglaense TaxID=2893752 RepID=A0A9Q3UYV9_9FLAO|nr:TetR/AcrR family transcriptional regulator [Chryseobacterium muglaense]MBD3903305.1 TetR/AcrR family transcriptional regulator [Chryseobacterium muglaense]MCC9036135.1 TetR/AcrR family transcriptional regulator [Chryseobacterium muglaense]MCM2553289.1 TetR/AcrR family transcriptional regulator [Chryseobacterium muglaense]
MTDTEKKIKDVTIELLLKEGRFGVSLQEIAKKSKISRTVIHYYFRSKERLFEVVKKEIVDKLIIPRYQKLFDEKPLKVKIENFLAESEKNLQAFPFADIYIMTEFAESEYIRNYFESIRPSIEALLSQIRNAIIKKQICNCDPVQFLIDLLALSSYSHLYLNFVKTNKILTSDIEEGLVLERHESIRKIILFQNL